MASGSEPACSGSVSAFLASFRVDKGHEFTHTSMAKPAGSFYVPTASRDAFFDVYKAALARGDDLFLTERHRHIGPVVVDFDFRYDPHDGVSVSPVDGQPQRLHTHRLIRSIVEIYAAAISEIVDVGGGYAFECFVLEKPSGPTIVKGVVKDGVHLIFPSVVTRPEVQLLVRLDVLAAVDAACKEALPTLLNRVEDVVDEAVIERNNWMMYGSKKCGSEPYRVTARYSCSASSSSVRLLDPAIAAISEADLVTLLSIRNKLEESPIRETQRDRVSDLVTKREEEAARRAAILSVISTSDNPRTNTCDDLEQVQRLVEILAPERLDNYSDWIRLGWCLRNIDHRLLDTWIDFSKRSPKYVEGECPRLWNSMRSHGLGVRTLHMWARHDSPEKYREVIRQGLYGLVTASITGVEYDVACVVYHMYRHEFVCSNIRTKTWYAFRDHRWRSCDSAHALRKHLSIEVFAEYLGVQRAVAQRAGASLDEAEQKQLTQQTKKLAELALKLKSTKFKDNVIRECAELFYSEHFENKLDSNGSLVGFENGVLDLERLEFREGRPDDYVSFSTGINHIQYVPDHPCVQEINRFWESVHPDPAMREYVLLTLSSCLSGTIREEKFYIWTGSGSNAKSVTVNLIEKTLGDYCCKFPVTLLTNKRAASGAATPEIARAKGRRFAVLQEPGDDERLNVGLMKELSGGDVVQTRELFKPPTEWKPQFKLFLLCNQLPQVPSDDGGTWRRIRVVEFGSKFVERPDPNNPREFPMDPELHSKLDGWREHFAAMLIEAFKRYIQRPIHEPAPVTACTRDYQRTNDHLADFIDSCIEKTPAADSTLRIDQAYAALRDWARAESIQLPRSQKRSCLVKYLDRYTGRSQPSGTTALRASWPGLRLRQGDADANANAPVDDLDFRT
jgi:P4 family phage/plasmid primase-like protien